VKDALAEKLLAHVMPWGPEEVAVERPYLQAMAAYKYDEYQQFSPGMRFVESLARWLSQFRQKAERQAAFEFVKSRLLFISTAEMNHLAESAYPDHVRPLLMQRAAAAAGLNRYHVPQVANSPAFKLAEQQCLFLGLSDGARIDVFRRANRELSTEQIVQTHEISTGRVDDLLESLAERTKGSGKHKFRTVVLIDDFSASGTSYYAREPKADGSFSGKIAKFRRRLLDKDDPLSRLVDVNEMQVVFLLYVATADARKYLIERSDLLWGSGVCGVEIVQLIPDDVRLTQDDSNPFCGLLRDYYDHSVFDKHFEKGGTDDARYGYAGGALPLVLHHNSPNNSIALLWSYEDRDVCGLFPRVQRHKEAT
jgi:hypothetical protein